MGMGVFGGLDFNHGRRTSESKKTKEDIIGKGQSAFEAGASDSGMDIEELAGVKYVNIVNKIIRKQTGNSESSHKLASTEKTRDYHLKG